jgi:pimeloyl-ACP methyl ester carboxylesterase
MRTDRPFSFQGRGTENVESLLTKSLSKALLAITIIGCCTGYRANAQNELDVLYLRDNVWFQYQNMHNSLYNHMLQVALPMLEKRIETVGAINTLAAWQERQRYMKDKLLETIGPFPDRTPLNPRVLRILKKDGFRVEHIVFESQPGFYVTGSLFVPTTPGRRGKLPAIIFCSGHAQTGYRTAGYQHEILNYVKKGFVVFAFDPLGQGERFQYSLSDRQELKINGPTLEHSYAGAQTFIAGSSLAKYMIWDGIRSVDYLLTRKEIDPSRIGITGRSGGGTQAAYIAAVDDRIHTAVLAVYITNFKRLLQSTGPQDAEQNLFNGIARGIDHADFLAVRAPKPMMIETTTNDIFSIQGARETATEVRRIYQSYGKDDNFKMTEDVAGHASTKSNREAKYAFFQLHLNNPGSYEDEEVEILTPEEIAVTSTGQVITSFGGETVFSLNRNDVVKCMERLEKARLNLPLDRARILESAKKLSGYRPPGEIEEPVFTGKVIREDYVIEKYFIKGEGDYVVPFLLFVPHISNNKTILYIHPSGKNEEADTLGEIAQFANKGYTVLAPDLIGTGETGPGNFRGDSYIQNISYNIWFFSILTGRSIVGIRASDIVRLTKYIQQKTEGSEIIAIANGNMGAVLLHAAAFYPHYNRIVLKEPLSSYRSLVEEEKYEPMFIHNSVAGALQEYDLPDLAAILAPGKLLIWNMVGGNGDKKSLDMDIQPIRQAYKSKNAEDNLKIIIEEERDSQKDRIIEWVQQ